MTAYTGDPEVLNAQVREFLAGKNITDEAMIAALHALAYENGGDVELAHVALVISGNELTAHTPLAFLDDNAAVSDDDSVDLVTPPDNPKLRRQALAYVLRAGGDEALGEKVYNLSNRYGFSLELSYRYLTMPDDEPPPVAIDPRFFSFEPTPDLPDDPELRAQVYAFVLAQDNGTEAMAADVYALVRTGVDMQLAYRELSTSEPTPAGDAFSLFGDPALDAAFSELPLMFEDAERGDRVAVPGGHPFEGLDLSSLSGQLGLDLSQVIGMGADGAVEINVSALIDAMAAGSGAKPSDKMKDVIAHMVGEQLQESAAGKGVSLNLSNQPLLSPNQRLQAVLTGWGLKGLLMFDSVKDSAGKLAGSIVRRLPMKNNETAAEAAVRLLELSLRLSAVLLLVQAIRKRKTDEGSRILQWVSIVTSVASIVTAAAKLAGIVPLKPKKPSWLVHEDEL